MKRISKQFGTIKQAESYLNRLYGKYNSVQLVNFPAYSESGIYTFLVS